jgi:hypothetical protein
MVGRVMRPTPLAFALALAACSAPQDHAPSLPPPCPSAPPAGSASASASAAPEISPDPASVENAEGSVKTIASRDDVPLTGPRVDGKPGDWLVDNGVAAVVVSQEGRIVDYGLRGERDEMVWLNPTIAFGLTSLDTPVRKIAAVAGNKALRLERAVAGKPAVLVSWIYLKGASLHVETAAEGTGEDPALAVTLGERVSWGNVTTWMDGHGYITDAAKITGAFLARDALGVAYALCSENGPLYSRFDEQEFAGLFEPGRTGESVVLVPAHGRSAARSIAVTASKGSIGDAVMEMPCGPRGARKRIPIQSAATVPRARLEVARCGEGDQPGKPFVEFRHVLDKPAPGSLTTRTIELPDGCFRARFTAPGHAPGDWLAPEGMRSFVVDSQLPRAGKLAFSVTEGGKPLPARIVVRGEGKTPDPDWGDDADGTGAASNVLATETGSGEVFLPPGKYRVLVNRGFEYTAKEEKIEVKRDKTVAIKVALDRVVDTKGWITADLHLHAVPSSDAPSLLTDRIRSLVAGGIEVAVATDHNAVTDYRPTIGELGLKERITNLIGDEITTRDAPWGHFNAFPFDAATRPFTYKDTTPAAIFAEVRAAKPYGKDTIVQVNHPRMGNIGYFDLLRFDPTDIPGWLKRSPLADMSFDAFEVFNGDHYTKIHKVEECLSDWYALLNAGYRPTATGNSDSHRVSFHEPGVPRNLVQVPDDDPAKLSERAFLDAVRAGKVVVSSGPFVTLKIGDKGVGETVAAGESEIVATVDGPPWVDIDEVMLVKRGEKLDAWKVEKAQGKRPWQFRTKTALKSGDWVIAIARGKKPMTYLYRPGAIPFAFTNPVFVK